MVKIQDATPKFSNMLRRHLKIFSSLLLLPCFFSGEVQAGQGLNAAEVLEEAFQEAQAIENNELKLNPLERVARTQTKLGGLEASDETIQRLFQLVSEEYPENNIFKSGGGGPFGTSLKVYVPWRQGFLIEIAQLLGDGGGQAAAIETLKKVLQDVAAMEEPTNRLSTYQEVLSAQVKISDPALMKTLEKSLSFADTMESPRFRRVQTLVALSLVFSEEGDKPSASKCAQQALGEAQAISGVTSQVGAFQDVAIAMARLGDNTGAEALTQRIEDLLQDTKGDSESSRKESLVRALCRIAGAHLEAGSRAEAEDNIQAAFEIAHTIEDEYDKSAALQSIAVAQAKAGNVEGVLKTEGSIKDPQFEGISYRNLAQFQLKAGDLEGAFRTAELLGKRDKTYRGFVLLEIAKAQAEKGDIESAFNTTELMSKSRPQFVPESFAAIAAARIRAGEGDKVYQWALSLPTPMEKAYTLIGVAEGLMGKKIPRARSTHLAK